MTAAQTIGFIGLGAMASRMAVNLGKAGYKTVAYTPSGKGGNGDTPFLATAAEVARAADIILVCVPDDEALETCMYGEQGTFAGMKSGGLVLNTSSVSPEATQALFEEGQRLGITVIDCPVSGSTPEAEAAALLVLVGRDDAAMHRAKPVFAAFARLFEHACPARRRARSHPVIYPLIGVGQAPPALATPSPQYAAPVRPLPV